MTMMTKNALLAITLATGIAMAFSTTPATASDQDTFVFKYDARELSSERGSKAMHDRLTRQVRHACSSGSRGVHSWRAERECRTFLIDEVLGRLGEEHIGVHHQDRRA